MRLGHSDREQSRGGREEQDEEREARERREEPAGVFGKNIQTLTTGRCRWRNNDRPLCSSWERRLLHSVPLQDRPVKVVRRCV